MRTASPRHHASRGASRPPSRPTAEAEARLREKDRLSVAYNQDRRRRIDALCEGPAGEQVRGLSRFLRAMDLRSGPIPVAYIEAADWARALPADDRALLLSIIGGAIRKMREAHGLPPLDDPMFDAPPNVFERCRALLDVR